MNVFLKRDTTGGKKFWFDIYRVHDGKRIGYIIPEQSGCHIESFSPYKIGRGHYADAKYAGEALAKHVTISKNDLQWLRKCWKNIQ